MERLELPLLNKINRKPINQFLLMERKKKLQKLCSAERRASLPQFSHGKGSSDKVKALGDMVHELQNTCTAELLRRASVVSLPKETVVLSPLNEVPEVCSYTSCFVVWLIARV